MSVFLGYLHPNEVAASFHVSLNELILHDAMHGHHLESWARIRSSGTDIPESRNELVKRTLDSGCEWLFMVDADMGFNPDTLDKLMDTVHPETHPIVGGLCFAYREQGLDGLNGTRAAPLPTIFDYIEHDDGEYRFTGRTHYPVNSVTPCAATGAACLVIHRSVLEKMGDEYGDWFTRIQGPDGLLGEDISFFLRAGALEIPVHVDTSIRTNHLKPIWVSEFDFWRSFDAPPADQKCTVVVPTVTTRAENIPKLAATLRASTGMAEPLFVADDEDHATVLKEYGRTVVQPGSFPVKVNYGYSHVEDPWMLIVGDDCQFRPGWLDHALLVAKNYDAKVVATNDLANPRVVRGEHATHPMVSTEYVASAGASWDGPGTVAHEGYRHWFCDDEWTAKAKHEGVFQAALASIVEHFHPIAGKADTDEVYEKNDRYASQDRDLFRKRLHANT